MYRRSLCAINSVDARRAVVNFSSLKTSGLTIIINFNQSTKIISCKNNGLYSIIQFYVILQIYQNSLAILIIISNNQELDSLSITFSYIIFNALLKTIMLAIEVSCPASLDTTHLN